MPTVPARLRIDVLGGQAVALPPSRKTRALLAFLVLTRRPQRRERLCEMFWELPDDPRGALRWSLSKLRPIVKLDCLVADRERVAFEQGVVVVDVLALRDHFERGNGLSDWDVADLSFDAFVRDLETVVDATEPGRFPLLGISQGCAVAIEYAVRPPERVSHLILWSGYAAGWRVEGDAELRAEREAHITLVRRGWGRVEPVYRQIFSATFMPGATHEELDWFNDFQRQTVSAANAARFLEVFADVDVRGRLMQIRAPTLVMHARDDRRVPIRIGWALAAGIEGAEFVALESSNHILLGREPASAEFVEQVRQFLAG